MECLLEVPKIQKDWFKDYYDTIKLECADLEILSYSMLENNIFGINNRFKKDLSGLIDNFIQNNLLQPEKTSFIIDCLVCALEDCEDLEYFEMAHNLNYIINSYDIGLFEYNNGYEVYYLLNPNDTNAF